MPQLSFFLVIVPLCCLSTIIIGIYHVLQIKTDQDPLHESIASLTGYLRDSLFVFLKRQLLLISVTVGALVLASLLLSKLHLHVNSLAGLITWGVGWSCVIGYIAIRKTTKITGDFLQQSLTDTPLWEENITRMGWAMTLLPLGILSLLLAIWLGVFQFILRSNIFQTGERLMHSAGISGPWRPDVLQNPAFQNMYQSELVIVLLAFCFGAMVQTFLVRITTQSMTHATDQACKHLSYLYPETDSDDLRNPICMAHHIGQYADQVWGKTSVMINSYLTVLLTSMAIMVAALRETPMTYEIAMVRAPFQIVCFGLLAASIASLLNHKTLFKQAQTGTLVISILSAISFGLGTLPIRALEGIVLSLLFTLLLFYLKEKKDLTTRASNSQLQGIWNTWRVMALTLGWLVALFMIYNKSTHVLIGLDGIALGIATFMAATLPYTAFLHRNTFVTIAISNARILHVAKDLTDKINDTLQTIQKHRPFTLLRQLILMTSSLLFLFFIFFETMPYWLQKISHPRITEKLTTLNQKNLAITTLSDLNTILGLSPTKAPFLMGLMLSILIVIGLGVFWSWRVSCNADKLFEQAEKQINEDERIMKGEHLPSYQASIEIATTSAYKSSFGLALAVGLGGLAVADILGFGGLGGLFMGMIFCTALSGIYAFCHAQWRDNPEPELSSTLIGLSTQAMLLFAILFSVFLLYVGHGL
jgi:Na+/H+-translocating membrane pyrophosphatase